MMVATRSTEECSASEISASEPMAMPTTSFASAMLPLAAIEIAATEVLVLEACAWVAVMGGGLAGRGLTSSRHPQARVATHSQMQICCELFRLKDGQPRLADPLPLREQRRIHHQQAAEHGRDCRHR